VSWRGTLLLVVLAGLALGALLFAQRSRTRSAGEPLLTFDPEAAEKISIEEGSGRVDLVKKGELWQIETPVADRANPEAVKALLGNAAGMEALDQLHPRDLKGNVSLEALGLKQPRKIVTIMAKGKHTVSFGADGAAAGQIYARVDSDRSIYLVPADTASVAFRPSAEFRDPRITALAPERLEEITLLKNEEGVLQQLRLKQTSGNWMIESPVTARADRETVTKWASSLIAAKVMRWLPDGTDPSSCGLDLPAATITAHEEGREPVTITIGSEVTGETGNRYAKCSDRPGICILGGIGEAIAITPASLRSGKPQTVALDAVDKIEIGGTEGSAPLIITRKKGSGDWEIPGTPVVIPATKVAEWHEKFSSITARNFETATPDRLALRGLHGTPRTIRFIAHLSENTAEESAGDMVLAQYYFGIPSEGFVAMREGNSPDLMVVPENALELANGPKTTP